MLKKNNKLTYISLFSSAGVGCFGFKQTGFECIATNELIQRRLNIQRYNHKCTLETGYINGDITRAETKKLIFSEIEKWKNNGNDKVDVVIATPPCQGMSVANHKKAKNEIVRNSLVVESIEMIKNIKPRFFVFENVAAFMKTGCTAPNGEIMEIGKVIYDELGQDYVITHRILNFKNYGGNSSRTRTIVIGVIKELSEYIAPIELYPFFQKEKTLREVIGDLPDLKWGEFSHNDFYHQFRTYPKNMRCWIHDLKEGEGAFSNRDISKRPHRIVDGKIVLNQEKNGDKYTRQFWDKVAPCIHTRNDQMASQNTVHPIEDRVFSIRELMRMMTIPDEFRWMDKDLKELNALPSEKKRNLLKKEEINIRQSIGEAVPTVIFQQIAINIKSFMSKVYLNNQQIHQVIARNGLNDLGKLKDFIKKNPMNLGYATLARIAELTNSKRENNDAYFTNKFIINEICGQLPDTDRTNIRILEPSVGIGNFLPLVMRKYDDKNVVIDVVDIDAEVLELLKLLLEKAHLPQNCKINYIQADFLSLQLKHRYFLTVGNPPFTKMKRKEVGRYLKDNCNKDTTNLFEFFLEKAMKSSDNVAMITPKSLLNTPEFETTRKLVENYHVSCIQDFGEQGFKGVLVETICIFIDMNANPQNTTVVSTTLNRTLIQPQKYIFDDALPYWVIYRDSSFDNMCERMELGIFNVYRDRQITNSNTFSENKQTSIRVLKSRNIKDDGSGVENIVGYDRYIDKKVAEHLKVYKFVNDMSVYLTPNMTYKPRVIDNIKNTIVNGSVAVLIPKDKKKLTKRQLKFFSSQEYRAFYAVARNFQTRSLNVDDTSVYWFGKLKGRDSHA